MPTPALLPFQLPSPLPAPTGPGASPPGTVPTHLLDVVAVDAPLLEEGTSQDLVQPPLDLQGMSSSEGEVGRVRQRTN